MNSSLLTGEKDGDARIVCKKIGERKKDNKKRKKNED